MSDTSDARSFVVQDHDAVTLISIGAERVDYMIIDRIRRIADSAKNLQFNRSIVIDLAEVESVSSMIMGSLVDLMKQMRHIGQKLILAGMKPRVRQAFAQTRLELFFEIHEDAQSAIRMLTTSRKP